MSTKERWTVYPLLLLAIGLAVRSNVPSQARVPGLSTGTVIADTVYCKELAIVTDDGQIIVHASRAKEGNGGRIEIRDISGTDAIAIGTSADSPSGAIDFFDAEGSRRLRFSPSVAPPPQPAP